MNKRKFSVGNRVLFVANSDGMGDYLIGALGYVVEIPDDPNYRDCFVKFDDFKSPHPSGLFGCMFAWLRRVYDGQELAKLSDCDREPKQALH